MMTRQEIEGILRELPEAYAEDNYPPVTYDQLAELCRRVLTAEAELGRLSDFLHSILKYERR